MRYSMATVCLSGTLREKVPAIARAGFAGIEIFENDLIAHDGSLAEVRRMVEDHGLEIVTYQPFRDSEGMPEPLRARTFDRAERKFDVMQALGCELLMVCSSVSPLALGGVSRAADDFSELGERARVRGLRVAFEALAWGRHVHDYRDAWEIVRRADHPSVGLTLDTFHIFSRDTDLGAMPSIPGGLIKSQVMHTSDDGVCLTLNSSQAARTLSNRLLAEHAGTGVQHIALAAADIFAVAGSLRAAGLAVLRMPRNYYDDLAARFGLPKPVLARMHDLGILYDEHEHGSFHQLYTRHFRRRFCFEVVQRNGYRGFGAANAPVRISMQTRELALA